MCNHLRNVFLLYFSPLDPFSITMLTASVCPILVSFCESLILDSVRLVLQLVLH